MSAVQVTTFGAPSVLAPSQHPVPSPGPNQVLVRVVYAGVNRADTLQRKGSYAPPAGESDVLGMEVAGVVEEVGEGVEGHAVGDRVCALLGSGGYAEYALIDAPLAIPVPDGVELDAAGGFPEAFITAYQAMVFIGNLSAGETMLIHGGASGVGTAATQLAKLVGARVIVTASAGKHGVCAQVGADVIIDYKSEDWVQRVKEESQGGVHLVVDYIGSAYFAKNLDVLKRDGRMVMLGFLSGAVVDGPLSLGPILKKRLQITGSTLRTRSLEYKSQLVKGLVDLAYTPWSEGAIKVVIDSEFALADAAGAHTRMEANANAGKIVLNCQ